MSNDIIADIDEALNKGRAVPHEYAALAIERAEWLEARLRKGRPVIFLATFVPAVGLIAVSAVVNVSQLWVVVISGIIGIAFTQAAVELQLRRIRRGKARNEPLQPQ